MKNIIRSAAFACGLISASAMLAQNITPAPGSNGYTVTKSTAPAALPGLPPLNISMLTSMLKLSGDQAEKLKAIDTKYGGMVQQLASTLTPEQRKEAISKLIGQREGDVKALLSPDQLKQYATARQPTGAPLSPSAPMKPTGAK